MMSYNAKTDWKYDDTPTEDDMNRIEQGINDVTESAAAHTAEEASLDKAGHVKLSNSTNSTNESLAATPKAVKAAMDRADAAFQFANDGKTDIASVIGSPATSGNTFAQLKTHIQNAKNKGATNLTNKGTSASGTESLDAIMGKIANVNTGKKFASGVSSTGAYDVVTVRGLNFKPRMIFIYYRYSAADTTEFHYMENIRGLLTSKGTVLGYHTGIVSTGSTNGASIIFESTNQFTNCFYIDGFAAYLSTNSSSVSWYAWE